MDVLDVQTLQLLEKHFTGLLRPCPSTICGGTLSEFQVERVEPFKAFLWCPKCESRLRVWKKGQLDNYE